MCFFTVKKLRKWSIGINTKTVKLEKKITQRALSFLPLAFIKSQSSQSFVLSQLCELCVFRSTFLDENLYPLCGKNN